MHINVTCKITVSRPKNRAEDPQNCQKKLFTDVLKDPKTSLEHIRVAHNAFSCYDTISSGRVRQILKKYGVSSRNAAKVILKKNEESKDEIKRMKKVFSFKMVYQDAEEAVVFLAECCFY